MIRRSRRANNRRHRLSTPSQTHRRFAPRLEALENRQMLAGDDVIGDVIAAGDDAADELTAGVSGRKWEDRNANGIHDPGEPGLPGVIIYSDLNRNGVLDRNEPFTRTSRDIPETDFDEAGLYVLSDLPAGPHVIREVVPDLYEQTFPPVNMPILDDPGGIFSDEFASVEPERLVMRLDAGQVRTEGVAVTVHPFCIRPIDVDVVSSNPDIAVKNLSGVQQNGCGGDATKFEVAFEGDGTSHRFQLHFVDALSGTPFAAIPVLIMAPSSGGAHHIILEAGQHVDGLHFGNRYVGPERGSIMGTKWLDANGNAEQDPGEPGIAGVTIYLDLNFNNELDPHEPTTTTAADNPLTDRDEAGFYRFGDVDPGRYAVREVVPEGSIQTYPQLIVIDPLPPLDGLPNGASHFVAVRPGEAVTGIDFGNQPVKPAAIYGQKWLDRNGNGVREDNEPGLAGVTIYVDRNYNSRRDDGEPFAVSQADNPNTRVDETGWYSIANLRPGFASIREIVPDGFQQTFPQSLAADRWDGQHFVYLGSGEEVRGLDFGNQRIGEAAVTGIKWFDRNSNGQQEPNEPGLAGVVIYSDLNFNGQWDRTEPYAVTAEDNPDTLRDETGRYRLTGLTPGEHLIREVLPEGFVQTFPLPPDLTSTDPTNYPYYFKLEANDVKTNVDFGNRPKQMTGDFDEDGDIDTTDIDILAAAIRDFDLDPKFDLNMDDRLDLRDFVFMIKRVLLTDFGDSNLDGRFDSKDLIAVFQAGEYEDGIDGNSGWAEGDWSGDGDFDTQDLVVAFTDGGYTATAVALSASDVDSLMGNSDKTKRSRSFVS